MTELEQLENSVAKLDDAQFAKFAVWFEELQAKRWDQQLEDDAVHGKLDGLAEKAMADFRAGKTRSL